MKGLFPEKFAWGAATAAYQIEGAVEAEGRGASVWDMFCAQRGRVWQGHTGAVACDHYRRWAEDVALMREIGLSAYRFSVAWPRVQPEGTGPINAAGLAFYDRLVDALLAAGIEPWLTLFHWDLPHALYLRGGWLNPDMPRWFADYAAHVADRLSDRVRHWITLNEPQCFIGLGQQLGIHAPGDKLGNAEALLAAHHALLAHGRAVQAIRAAARTPPLVGWSPAGVAARPASESEADIAAARARMFSVPASGADHLLWNNAWWTEPVLRGAYPEDGLRVYGAAVPRFTDAEMALMAQPLDFFGVNLYHADTYRAGPDGLPQKVEPPPGAPHTHFVWPVTPDCLYWAPRFFAERYRLPVFITENGLSNVDWVARDGCVHDPQRVDFLESYLAALLRAVEEGVDVRGYFHWSLLDNFEWSEGYKHRFGLVHVDFETQRRTLKDSAFRYRDIIRSRGGVLQPTASPAAGAEGQAGI